MNDEIIPAASSLAHTYLRSFPDEAAVVLDGLPVADIAAVVEREDDWGATAILDRLRPDLAADVLALLPATHRRRTLAALDAVRSANLLSRLPDDLRESILADADPPIEREIRGLLSYPPDSAGSMMDPRVVVSTLEGTAQEALERLRRMRDRRVNSLYVVDRQGVYLGRVTLQEIAIADPDQALGTLITDPPVSVLATASKSEVVETLEGHRMLALPVVDLEGRLVGLIRNETLVEAVEQEATVDIQTMVGASRDERALSPVRFAVRKRLPWLQVNLLTAFLASFVVGLFEDTIARFTALAVLLPVVAGQSGNTGAQALAVTMRGLALREIRVRHALRVAVKESLVGAINGVAVALVTSAAVYGWSRSAGLAAVIGVSMVFSMMIAGLAGSVIPIVLTVAGQDPAQASSIILTTVTDVFGFLSFLGLATLAASAL